MAFPPPVPYPVHHAADNRHNRLRRPAGCDATAEQADPQQGRRVRRSRGRRQIAAFEKLPVRQQVHDLPENEKPCPCCGEMRREIGRESTWQIEHIPAEFLRIEHIQMKYACSTCEQNGHKPLTAFLTDGAIALDNNVAEREMKRIALGRKNYLFVGNARGGETAAILSSITSTCRRHGIDPQLYLTQLLTNLGSSPASEIDQWLPDQWHQRHIAAAT